MHCTDVTKAAACDEDGDFSAGGSAEKEQPYEDQTGTDAGESEAENYSGESVVESMGSESSVEEAVAELSQGMTLQKGTVIATGTPAGVAMGMNPPVWLKSGDVVCCEIGKIGVLRNVVA